MQELNQIRVLLMYVGLSLFFLSAPVLVWGLSRNRGARKRVLLASLCLFVSGPLIVAASYALWSFVQLPAMRRAALPDLTNHPGTLTHVGDQAPQFVVTAIDGTKMRLSDFRGRVVLLNFFATWCGPCNLELPHLQQISDELHDKNFAVLAIAREETPETVGRFKQEHHFRFAMESDPDRSIYGKYATEAIPRTYLLSKEGTIIYQTTGFYDEEIPKLEALIRTELGKR